TRGRVASCPTRTGFSASATSTRRPAAWKPRPRTTRGTPGRPGRWRKSSLTHARSRNGYWSGRWPERVSGDWDLGDPRLSQGRPGPGRLGDVVLRGAGVVRRLPQLSQGRWLASPRRGRLFARPGGAGQPVRAGRPDHLRRRLPLDPGLRTARTAALRLPGRYVRADRFHRWAQQLRRR